MSARLASALIAILVCISTAPAQPLADRVPDDAMIYVGWQGIAEMGEAYQNSHLKSVVDATDWQQVYEQFLPAVIAKVGQEDAEAKELFRMASAIGRALWRYETAVYFGGLIAGQREGPPAPKLAILIRAGNESEALVKEITSALDEADGEIPFPIKAAAYGDLVAVTTGAWPGFEALLGNPNAGAPPAPALTTNGKFADALQHAQPKPVIALYIDVEAIVKMADGFVALGAQPRQQQIWRKARRVAGIGNVKQLALTGAFDGKDWITRGFLGAPVPRQGLVALLDGDPMSDDFLKLVPQDTLVLSAGRADLARFVSHARTTITAADPQWGRHVDEALAKGSEWAGLDIEKDLLAPLGPEWAFYISPSVGGTGLLGLCIVNRPRDPAKADSSLATLARRATQTIAEEIGDEPTIAFKSRQTNGLTLHYLATPFVTPTWCIADGNLYIALYPQVVTSAAAHVKRNGPSIASSEKLAAVRKRLGGQPAASICFADLPRTAPNAYGSWLAISRIAGFADIFGVDSPLMLIPPIDRLTPHLAPIGQVTWVDDAGWHYSSVTPFPGADLLAQDPLGTFMLAQPAGMIGVLRK